MSVAGIRDVHQLGLSSSIFKTNDWGLNNVRVCHLPHVTSSGYTVEGFISLWWHQEPGFLLYFQSVLLRVQPSFILTATRVPAVMLSHWAGRRNGVLWAHGPGPCWGLWPHSPGLLWVQSAQHGSMHTGASRSSHTTASLLCWGHRRPPSHKQEQ